MFVPFLLILLPFGEKMVCINEFRPSRTPVKRGSRSCNTVVHYLTCVEFTLRFLGRLMVSADPERFPGEKRNTKRNESVVSVKHL